MKQGHLILINGASSVGKSSTCAAFQNVSNQLYVKLGIDIFWTAITPKQLNIMEVTPDFYQTKTYYKNEKPYFHITPGPLLDAVIYASYKAIGSYLHAGINVISDQLFWKPEWFSAALKEFRPYQVYLIGLFASDEEGARREKKRSQGNACDTANHGRPDGWNRCSALITHKNMKYDFEIDNTHLDIDHTAKKILDFVKNCNNPTAFNELYNSFFN